MFGAVDFTAALVRVAKVLGYRVTVCDARPIFATRARFPLADEIVVDWPNRLLERIGPTLTTRDAICVLTHDIKFDVPAIVSALQTDVGYLGAMGSRRTNRRARPGCARQALTTPGSRGFTPRSASTSDRERRRRPRCRCAPRSSRSATASVTFGRWAPPTGRSTAATRAPPTAA